nr:MAG TPA: hypothetical protein [Caudoviricetes sp.]
MPWNRTTFYTITLSSTLVGNTQIKLTLREYNLQHYSCQLNLIYKRWMYLLPLVIKCQYTPKFGFY